MLTSSPAEIEALYFFVWKSRKIGFQKLPRASSFGCGDERCCDFDRFVQKFAAPLRDFSREKSG